MKATKHTPSRITSIAAPEFEIKKAALPDEQRRHLRAWCLHAMPSDRQAAKRIGIEVGVLLRARNGKIIQARHLYTILEFLKTVTVDK